MQSTLTLVFTIFILYTGNLSRLIISVCIHVFCWKKIEQLLEVTARAVHLVIGWGESGLAVADGLSNLLKVITYASWLPQKKKKNWSCLLFSKTTCIICCVWILSKLWVQCRLSATVRCLSHPSAHVRALSTSVLRDIMQGSSAKSSSLKNKERNGICDHPYRCMSIGTIDWHADIDKCIKWEAHSRLATGLTLVFLDAAAKDLGCLLPCW